MCKWDDVVRPNRKTYLVLPFTVFYQTCKHWENLSEMAQKRTTGNPLKNDRPGGVEVRLTQNLETLTLTGTAKALY
jgi:hypothetical protein